MSHVHHKVLPEDFGHDHVWLQAVHCLIFSSAASNASACSFFHFLQLTESTILSPNLIVKTVLFHVQIFSVTAYFPNFLPMLSGSMTTWREGHFTFPTLSLLLRAQAGIRLELNATGLPRRTTVL